MVRKELFDTAPARRGTGCYKWDNGDDADVLEMWVADMDFAIAPNIAEAIGRRAQHPVYGYTKIRREAYDAVVGWQAASAWAVKPEWIQFTTGVVPALSAVIKALAKPGEAVLLLTPVYNCFFSSIRNNGCEVVECPLVREGGRYVVDYEAMERAIEERGVRLYVLCNPHNPVGRVWSAEELRRMGDICKRHGVVVVSDEIHSGIVMPGHKFTPFGSLGYEYMDNSVVLSSASKSFNIAGLQLSYIITNDRTRYEQIDRAININEVCDVNPFGVEALIAAYSAEGKAWLDDLNEYVSGNFEILKQFVAERPSLGLTELEGTYLAWLDISRTGQTTKELWRKLLTEAKVRFSPGTIYGAAGEGFLRINLACPRGMVKEALRRVGTVIAR